MIALKNGWASAFSAEILLSGLKCSMDCNRSMAASLQPGNRFARSCRGNTHKKKDIGISKKVQVQVQVKVQVQVQVQQLQQHRDDDDDDDDLYLRGPVRDVGEQGGGVGVQVGQVLGLRGAQHVEDQAQLAAVLAWHGRRSKEGRKEGRRRTVETGMIMVSMRGIRIKSQYMRRGK
jgi:hypothetical protein